jgi:DNA-binding transcriptional ArsR family regulator
VSAAGKFAPCCGVLSRLWVPSEQQWMKTTGGRVAPDGYSWLQAVHWVVVSGCYVPVRSHGPREMGRTTVRVAQELAQLSPCRPGVEFLASKLQVKERTVEYHLSMLRESGLLVYIERGTRVRGERARASEFALVIPVEFDRALGIRTAGEGTGRRMVGIAEAGRELMARMGGKAARMWRAARPKRSAKACAEGADSVADQAADAVQHPMPQNASGVSGDDSRCTPMEGGSSVCVSDGPSLLPPESKLASGEQSKRTGNEDPAAGGGGRKRRVLNRVGRRYQLAFELVQQVPWLNRAAVPRIAWVVRELADAGWTAEEVLGWLETTQAPSQVRRPSAFLAARVRAVHLVITTPVQRAALAEARRDSRHSQAARHTEAWDQDWTPPRSQATRREVEQRLSELGRGPLQADAPVYGEDDQVLLEDLTRAEVLQLRDLARNRPELVVMAFESMGEAYARRLYTNAVVDQLLRIPVQGTRMVVNGGWGQW